MSRGTTHRTVRVEDTLWARAKARSDERGESLSEIIREALRRYVDEDHNTEL